ncbi:hypothetical protein llap_2472 [Limosa lapponica baueri]|uniref:Uncharacterized protein n=1 Tax=Limosa lapponica baueri TaxID=1758121 RepID=A0A2I0UMH9_LIMLA|nr:hypothetical protein llap_2472 [Limosa lapponica baueri]
MVRQMPVIHTAGHECHMLDQQSLLLSQQRLIPFGMETLWGDNEKILFLARCSRLLLRELHHQEVCTQISGAQGKCLPSQYRFGNDRRDLGTAEKLATQPGTGAGNTWLSCCMDLRGL